MKLVSASDCQGRARVLPSLQVFILRLRSIAYLLVWNDMAQVQNIPLRFKEYLNEAPRIFGSGKPLTDTGRIVVMNKQPKKPLVEAVRFGK